MAFIRLLLLRINCFILLLYLFWMYETTSLFFASASSFDIACVLIVTKFLSFLLVDILVTSETKSFLLAILSSTLNTKLAVLTNVFGSSIRFFPMKPICIFDLTS